MNSEQKYPYKTGQLQSARFSRIGRFLRGHGNDPGCAGGQPLLFYLVRGVGNCHSIELGERQKSLEPLTPSGHDNMLEREARRRIRVLGAVKSERRCVPQMALWDSPVGHRVALPRRNRPEHRSLYGILLIPKNIRRGDKHNTQHNSPIPTKLHDDQTSCSNPQHSTRP